MFYPTDEMAVRQRGAGDDHNFYPKFATQVSQVGSSVVPAAAAGPPPAARTSFEQRIAAEKTVYAAAHHHHHHHYGHPPTTNRSFRYNEPVEFYPVTKQKVSPRGSKYHPLTGNNGEKLVRRVRSFHQNSQNKQPILPRHIVQPRETIALHVSENPNH